MFENARMKVQRAQGHAADLERTVASFFEANPVRCIFRQDHASQRTVVDMNPPQIPEEWAMIVGDTFHCLRTALDHAAFDIVAPKGAAVNATAFPFAVDRNALTKKNRAYRLIEKANRKAARAVRDLIKPTSDGDRVLWCLNQLAGLDRRRRLITTSCAVVALLPAVIGANGTPFRNQAAGGLRVNRKLTLPIGPIGSRILGVPVFSPQIFLGEDGHFEGRSVQKAFAECLTQVDGALDILERACE